jgi:hypothetical protein
MCSAPGTPAATGVLHSEQVTNPGAGGRGPSCLPRRLAEPEVPSTARGFSAVTRAVASRWCKALDEAHAVVIVQALQRGAIAQVVLAASLDGKDRLRLLWDWMKALEQTMASEGGPAIPDPLILGGSEQECPGS